jgi:hypothetical protein
MIRRRHRRPGALLLHPPADRIHTSCHIRVLPRVRRQELQRLPPAIARLLEITVPERSCCAGRQGIQLAAVYER